jgi:hypothetical protein
MLQLTNLFSDLLKAKAVLPETHILGEASNITEMVFVQYEDGAWCIIDELRIPDVHAAMLEYMISVTDATKPVSPAAQQLLSMVISESSQDLLRQVARYVSLLT